MINRAIHPRIGLLSGKFSQIVPTCFHDMILSFRGLEIDSVTFADALNDKSFPAHLADDAILSNSVTPATAAESLTELSRITSGQDTHQKRGNALTHLARELFQRPFCIAGDFQYPDHVIFLSVSDVGLCR